MQEALEKAERLLRSYGYDYEANLATIALALFAKDPLAACRSINTAEWWESAQSLAGASPRNRDEMRRPCVRH